MIPIELYDDLTFTRSGSSIHTTCPTNPDLSGGTNLAHKAAKAWLDESGTRIGVQIEIHKKIPIQAGLGGGSSDAAATLLAMQSFGKRALSQKRLLYIATKLGADVPFFLSPHARFARGIGEILGPRQYIEPVWLILAVAPFGLSTHEVFKHHTIPLTIPHISVNDEPPRKWGLEQLIRLTRNDLQRTAENMHPDIARVRKSLISAGATCASMSGSGPSVFSLFNTEESARKVIKKVDGNLGWTYLLLRAIT